MNYTSKIIEIKEETHDTKSIKFEKPQGFNYKAGQYCIFEHNLGEDLIKRSYSLSSSPTENFLQITVKHIPNGIMSTYLHQMKIGDSLVFVGPIGKFVFDESFKNVVFIAGGSGISPFRAMCKYVFDKNIKDIKITVIYGSRSPEDIIMVNELNDYLKGHPNFKLYLTVDRPNDTWQFHTGFIDANFIKEATQNSVKNKDYFLVGPTPMMTAIKNALLSLDVEEKHIHLDAWG